MQPQAAVMLLLVLATACAAHTSATHAHHTQESHGPRPIPASEPIVSEESSWGEAELFERIVAVVDKDVITFGELLAEAKIALLERHGAEIANVHPSATFLASFLDLLVDQLLIAREARRMGSVELEPGEIDARLLHLENRFASPEGYSAFVAGLDMPPGFVREVMARNGRNERYVHQRLRTRLIGYESMVQQAPAQNPNGARESRMLAVLKEWLQELRQSVEVQVLGQDNLLRAERPRA